MNSEAIFLPMLVLMLLTALVWLYMYSIRIPAMRRAGKPAQTYTTPDKLTDVLPERIGYPANNLKNLFELPVLFYVLCLYLHVTGNVDSFYLAASWAFVGLRIAHSIVHCTWNTVMQRFLLYAAGALVLWAMLLRASVDALFVAAA